MTKKKFFYITTPIFFVNAPPHIGHLYVCLLADFFTRVQHMQGNECIFITGADQHGNKIVKAAMHQNLDTRLFVSKMTTKFQDRWQQYDIQFSAFIQTTSPIHVKKTVAIINKLYNDGLIKYEKYTSFYCLPCEEYFTVFQAHQSNNICINCARPLSIHNADNYFFVAKSTKQWLINTFEKNKKLIYPPHYVQEISNNFLRANFQDFLIARTNTGWGIPVAFDSRFEIYVWFDALCAYFSVLDVLDKSGEKYRAIWKTTQYQIIHLIGKEIIRFHCIYFLLMLKTLGLNYQKVLMKVHGWVLVNDQKLSKSKHKHFDLQAIGEKFGSDSVRFFLLFQHDVFRDFSFTVEQITTTHNSILVNKVGNFFQRIFRLYQQKFPVEFTFHCTKELVNSELSADLDAHEKMFFTAVNKWRFQQAVDVIIKLVNYLNSKVDSERPWAMVPGKEQQNFSYEVFLTMNVLIYLMDSLFTKATVQLRKYFIFSNLANENKKTSFSTVTIAVKKKWTPLFNKM